MYKQQQHNLCPFSSLILVHFAKCNVRQRRDAVPLAFFVKKKYRVTSLLVRDATGIRFKVFLGCFSSSIMFSVLLTFFFVKIRGEMHFVRNFFWEVLFFRLLCCFFVDVLIFWRFFAFSCRYCSWLTREFGYKPLSPIIGRMHSYDIEIFFFAFVRTFL